MTLRTQLIGLCAGKESFTPGEARALAIAAARLALEDAAQACAPRDGYCTCDGCDQRQQIDRAIRAIRDSLGE